MMYEVCKKKKEALKRERNYEDLIFNVPVYVCTVLITLYHVTKTTLHYIPVIDADET